MGLCDHLLLDAVGRTMFILRCESSFCYGYQRQKLNVDYRRQSVPGLPFDFYLGAGAAFWQKIPTVRTFYLLKVILR